MENDRRRLLKALTLGGGAVTITKLPATWSKPVLESVMLPAHAQTSGVCSVVVSLRLDLTGNYEGGGEPTCLIRPRATTAMAAPVPST